MWGVAVTACVVFFSSGKASMTSKRKHGEKILEKNKRVKYGLRTSRKKVWSEHREF
jgi:hypothetical protein